jgi:hypothetical protein
MQAGILPGAYRDVCISCWVANPNLSKRRKYPPMVLSSLRPGRAALTQTFRSYAMRGRSLSSGKKSPLIMSEDESWALLQLTERSHARFVYPHCRYTQRVPMMHLCIQHIRWQYLSRICFTAQKLRNNIPCYDATFAYRQIGISPEYRY